MRARLLAVVVLSIWAGIHLGSGDRQPQRVPIVETYGYDIVIDDYALTGVKRPPVVTFVYNPAGAPPSTSVQDVIDGHMGWNDWSNFAFVFGGAMAITSSVCQGDSDGINLVHWGQRPAGILGTACYYGDGSECDIILNANEGWDDIDLRTVVLHEAGHCAGLAHSQTLAAVMYPSYQGPRGLDADDIAGLRAIYGEPAATATSTPTVALTPTPRPTATRTPTRVPTIIPAPVFRLRLQDVARD